MEKVLEPRTEKQCGEAFGVIRSFQSSKWRPDSYHRALSAANGLEKVLHSDSDCSVKYLCKRMINLWFTYMDWKVAHPKDAHLAEAAKDIVLFFYDSYSFSDFEIDNEVVENDQQVLEVLTRAKKAS